MGLGSSNVESVIQETIPGTELNLDLDHRGREKKNSKEASHIGHHFVIKNVFQCSSKLHCQHYLSLTRNISIKIIFRKYFKGNKNLKLEDKHTYKISTN